VSLDAWAPEHRAPAADEALALIASSYVRGHGPVTDRELARWTGLGLGESRAGLAAATGIVQVETEAGPAWVDPEALDRALGDRALADRALADQALADRALGDRALLDHMPTRLLPGFDEFMLGYSEAERAIDPAHHAAVVPGNNGMFKPVIVDRGRVVGVWERRLMAKSVRVTCTALAPLDAPARARIELAAVEVASYVKRPLDLRWSEG
jgi:hypothetical protein